jgi:hypothetical protein
MKKTKYIKEITSVDLTVVIATLETKMRKKSKRQILKEI